MGEITLYGGTVQMFSTRRPYNLRVLIYSVIHDSGSVPE